MKRVEGAISVKAALESRYRTVSRIYLNAEKQSSDISYIKQRASQSKVPVSLLAPFELEQMVKGKTHGGIIADVSDRKFQAVTSLLKKENPFLVLLEGVEDSFNLGYIFRSLYAFGCDGVILPGRSFDFEDETMIKSSAGASELIPIHISNDIPTDLQILRKNGITVLSTYRGRGSRDLYDYYFGDKKGVLFAIGGPLRGLSRDVLDNSDDFIYIPYANGFRNALNAASAATVVASEYYRARRKMQ
ncbi:MAG: RNA methyltransferase [Erysipelotrichaceae bacterium]|nr:RNA methyltransferase [Erysipelotrichaceae bacterium]